ncbi:hypothetical protein A3C59_01255 [Candidatus Daviesbacteria bacterium RIFCSPHIGHO2_02_FULL_36_13]|uniref:Uncharacterized protein n=1 Tax=Candidatus Daviesbacteria bacterium RIFCSPHIGHO2_02_FULL_36_13 TaxID=1797768 RepID=A0A1F5JX91_9BACT|nr:MAG: hypothetical protein A3C59_01255 [Candidatus Daviesbacteria bacterium RIFCSPHIGHO2_02_FULL_36_13]
MPTYQGPEASPSESETKFVRARETIFLPPPGVWMQHDNIVRLEDILEEVQRLRTEEPDTVDAGVFRFREGNLFVYDYSSSLRLPLSKTAREITLAQFRSQTPGYEVIDFEMYDFYIKKM